MSWSSATTTRSGRRSCSASPFSWPGEWIARGAALASGRPGSALTLIDAAVVDGFGGALDHRRNVVVRGTDLDALIGREFALGGARCRGRRRCGPCSHLNRLNGGGVLRPLVHRGGLRADIRRGRHHPRGQPAHAGVSVA